VLSTWSPENGTKTLERMNNTYWSASLKRIDVGNFMFYVNNVSQQLEKYTYGYSSLPTDAWEAYQRELRNWTEFIWTISDSDMYKSWAKDKDAKYVNPKFNFSGIKGPQVDKDQTTNPLVTNPTNAKRPVSEFWVNLDDQKTAIHYFWEFKAADLDKISNLEMQFAFVVQDLYADNVYK
jgi:hypothetical protein